MTAVLHAGREHSELGASSCARWAACPGSVRMLRNLTGSTSLAAQRGTAVHELAEAVLADNLKLDADNTLVDVPDGYLALDFVAHVFNGIEIDEAMAQCAEDYVAVCYAEIQEGDKIWIERRFDLDVLEPPLPMFGTADLVVYRPSERLLKVIDLKSGSGVIVQAVGNPQLRYYALGALLSLPGLPVDRVEMVIVQPCVGEPVKRDRIDAADLMLWGAELLELADAAVAEDAPLAAGEHCRFCGAKPRCKAFEARALEAARDEWDALDDDDAPLPDPAELDADDLARRLARLPLLEEWCRTMRAYAYQRLARGDAIPGWKLVAKRAVRKWTDEPAAVDWMLGRGLTRYEAIREKAISPAQAEKLLKDRVRGLDGFAELVASVSSGTALAAEDDPRPALDRARIPAADEFDIIDDPN